MITNKNLESFFNQYEDIIQTVLEYDYSEKEIFNAIYKKEFNNYLRKGCQPRLDELSHVVNFVRKFRSGELDVKSQNNSNQKSNIEIIRDNVHNLDLNQDKDYETYRHTRFDFIANIENAKLRATINNLKENNNNYYDMEIMSNNSNKLVHDDGQNNITIGYGFNTNRPEARIEWNNAFLEYNKNNPDNKIDIPNMQNVINLQQGMTSRQLEILTNSILNKKEKQLEKLYGNIIDENGKEVSIWSRLKPNEKITVESLNFNSKQKNNTGSTIVGLDTKFYLNIKHYTLSSNKQYLQNAINEVKYYSNSDNSDGIANRRDKEAILLNSTDCPLYSKPNESPLPEKYKDKYFRWIWHSSNSKNPNSYHRDVLNGNEYSLDSDEWKYMTSHRLKGCHCTYEIID